MQDAGGGGRFFGGGGRRHRPHGHHHHGQAVKCPRCDSPNTKFCYYNNYNLSQPRHFCRSCRRYWTKGGVLRNVPVGGGCRKAKRSSTKAGQEVAASTGDQASANPVGKTTTSSDPKNDGGPLLVGPEGESADFQTASGGGATSTMMTSSEEVMGFSSIVGDEFKAVDYGDQGLFDLTAAADPNYWCDQSSSLNFLP